MSSSKHDAKLATLDETNWKKRQAKKLSKSNSRKTRRSSRNDLQNYQRGTEHDDID